MLQREFRECYFSFVRREGNHVSHKLAKYAINLISEVKWKDSFPLWLVNLDRADVGAVAPN